ncbi:hypothetical protein CBR_g18631 [Chara braunii]|uniref:Uncharacterized protein n=1 Tax=Chara braunii TaxID=69332 RepID=A0A388JTA4_CHABU|nr:hypothetical protein CBR_g18631 [Chara braunii]|eukprot:GBG61036.1 hypothetical protein CBR_g18631 [Chara braunii]
MDDDGKDGDKGDASCVEDESTTKRLLVDGDKGDASCVEDESTTKRLLVKGCEGYGLPTSSSELRMVECHVSNERVK